MNKKILITYNYFLPAYKAGGPVQSIANICRQLYKEYDFYIVCGNQDLNETTTLAGIKSDEWNSFEQGIAQVYYISAGNQNMGTIRKIIKNLEPDVVFANGIFIPLFSIFPLMLAPKKKVVSVRGMLDPGALSLKNFKKQLFLLLFKLSGLHKRTIFHVTTDTEGTYVHRVFGGNVNVMVAQNFARQPKQVNAITKNAGELRLVTIALITPKKNHVATLSALRQVKGNVVYDIYGPIKDEDYWQKCKKIISELPANIVVTYKGNVEPDVVLDTLSNYHCYILPSLGENFGHAIYEALSVGKPVITSNFTPWNELEHNHCGWNIDITDIKSISSAIEKAVTMDDDTYQYWSTQTTAFAKKSVDFELIKQEYRQLFN